MKLMGCAVPIWNENGIKSSIIICGESSHTIRFLSHVTQPAAKTRRTQEGGRSREWGITASLLCRDVIVQCWDTFTSRKAELMTAEMEASA